MKILNAFENRSDGTTTATEIEPRNLSNFMICN